MSDGCDSSVPTFTIRPGQGWRLAYFQELWAYRELLYFLVWRDVKVRYKQTIIGAVWVVLQPMMTMFIFTIVFGYIARMPSEGLPYSVFFFTALLPWNYFADSVSRGGSGLINNANLVSKIYFPRLIIPLAATIVPVVDFLLSFLVLLGLMAWYGLAPGWGVLFVPFFLLLAAVAAFAVTLWFSALNVRFRDAGYLMGFVIQFWFYATPIVYPLSVVPAKWRLIYSINPMVGVVEGFRWALLGKKIPDVSSLIISVVLVAAILCGGMVYFRHTERTFADVI